SAITAAASSTAPMTASSQAGSASQKATALPGTMRLARKAANGVKTPIAAISAPRRSKGRRARAANAVWVKAMDAKRRTFRPASSRGDGNLLQKAVLLQPVDGHGLGRFAAHLDAPVERLQRRQVELGEHRGQQVLDLRILVQHR